MSHAEPHTELESRPSDPATSRQPSTILVPLDGTVGAANVVLPVAQSLAKSIGATMHILYVSSHPLPAMELCDSLHLTTEDLSGAVLDQRSGPPGAVIIEEAKRRESRLI